jgi:ferritin-like metal-binding protein YciE
MLRDKLLQYLNEAHATESGLARVLQSQIAVTPHGAYRGALERHLAETRDHEARVARRINQLGGGADLVHAAIGAAETVLAQGIAIGKLPLDLLRGHGGAEKVLKNAKDAAASEALEIATYTALERLARLAGDEETARLAVSIREQEQRMLDTILAELPSLVQAVAGGKYDVATTGAADTARAAAKKPAQRAKKAVRRRTTEPWPGYDEQTAEEIVAVLRDAGNARKGAARAYERAHKNRATVLGAA